MGRWVSLAACLLAGLLAACSPFGGGAYQCSTDSECGGAGRCAMGYCAFPDNGCDPSGLRYGDLSGPHSGQCVGGVTEDASTTLDMQMFNEDGVPCYGTGVVRACFTAPPTGTVTLDATINTDNDTKCSTDPRNAAWCVISGGTVNVQGTVNATGAKPLVLVSTGTIAVNGVLDVASHRVGGIVGAGGDATCTAGTAPTMTSGGAGGSFGGAGGAGATTGGGTGGQPGGTTAAPTTLRGGCRGQNGAGGGGGAGGHGGGAVYLIASTSITVIGTINASGSGGINANPNSSSGGGGGGAGGFIGLESPDVTVGGQVFANGGGGGEASGTSSTGTPGGDSPNATTAAAGGGDTSAYGTNGGNGSQGATLGGAPGASVCTNGCTTPNSGGGGGGGAGVIKVIPAQSTGGNVSPPAT